jgi:hypothetical protein
VDMDFTIQPKASSFAPFVIATIDGEVPCSSRLQGHRLLADVVALLFPFRPGSGSPGSTPTNDGGGQTGRHRLSLCLRDLQWWS